MKAWTSQSVKSVEWGWDCSIHRQTMARAKGKGRERQWSDSRKSSRDEPPPPSCVITGYDIDLATNSRIEDVVCKT